MTKIIEAQGSQRNYIVKQVNMSLYGDCGQTTSNNHIEKSKNPVAFHWW